MFGRFDPAINWTGDTADHREGVNRAVRDMMDYQIVHL